MSDLFDARLKLADPIGAIAFIEIDPLPETGEPQTAYLNGGKYYMYESSAWVVQELLVSDTSLNTWIAAYGVNKAVYLACKQILARLGREYQIKKQTAGADSTDYQSLGDLLSFYNALCASYKEDIASDNKSNTGRMFRSNRPEIAGGNL
jgi:hypothetical protein